MQTDLLDEQQAAQWLRVSCKTLQSWRCRNEGPTFVKVGQRLVRYKREDLERFVHGETR